MRERVAAARQRQVTRFASEKNTHPVACNAHMKARHLRALHLDDTARDLLKTAINQFSLSARAYDRILKVAQTISDLDSGESIQLHHVAEAVNYRTLDRTMSGP